MGDTFDESKMMTFGAGSFGYLDPSMHHYVMADNRNSLITEVRQYPRAREYDRIATKTKGFPRTTPFSSHRTSREGNASFKFLELPGVENHSRARKRIRKLAAICVWSMSAKLQLSARQNVVY